MGALRILGIDPGTLVVGFACVEVEEARARRAPSAEAPMALRASNLVRAGGGEGRVRLVEAGAVRLGRSASVGDRLSRLVTELESWIERFAPHEVALEEAFCGKSVQSALRIGEARGVVLATAHRSGLVVHQYPPARIKRRVAGHGAASKEAVSRMAVQALGVAGIDGPADATDAVAVALCRVEERRAVTFGRV
ncbi:MAG: crossover junction endodeoxyribonuclease RuvC [Planctomycetota bacterium]|nr:crossover junction endodeoxyribonuclease RuvC [Planctomycetota bacterium]MDA0932615.1 crossover junction endodeoxyribonuclease RuvC [Planctomycetota bacterium]MDA1220786.1 crossover junction endodeoxyribonuclease RuvC [Planctomycetota bacterium]